MPAFQGQLTDQQIQQIADFVAGLSTGQPPSQ
jgi:mono/diheme cytochrome c family protein